MAKRTRRPVTFREFQATGRYVDNLSAHPLVRTPHLHAGRVYMGGAYIERGMLLRAPGESVQYRPLGSPALWYLRIENEEYEESEAGLDRLERKLYEWARSQRLIRTHEEVPSPTIRSWSDAMRAPVFDVAAGQSNEAADLERRMGALLGSMWNNRPGPPREAPPPRPPGVPASLPYERAVAYLAECERLGARFMEWAERTTASAEPRRPEDSIPRELLEGRVPRIRWHRVSVGQLREWVGQPARRIPVHFDPWSPTW